MLCPVLRVPGRVASAAATTGLMRPLPVGAAAPRAINALIPAHHGRPLPGGWRPWSDAATMRRAAWSTAGHTHALASRRLTTIAVAHPSPLRSSSSSGSSRSSRRLSTPRSPGFCAFPAVPLYLQRSTTMSTSATSSSQNRSAHSMSGPYGTYEAVVVGAGPGGITAMGNLLENRIAPILWVDDSFDGGRVNQMYREVPSNTKVKLFIDFATATAPFRKIVSGMPSRSRWEEPSASDGVSLDSKDDRLQALRKLDQEKGCRLSNAADMCLMLTEGLRKTPGVITQQGRFAEAVFDESATDAPWTVRVDTHSEGSASISVPAKRVILCTGAHPTDPPLPVEVPGLMHLHLDTALSPTKLSASLSPLGPTTVAVIGASHSAILVLRNLADLALGSKHDLKIKWFTRHPLRYAEYEDGFIARDNTGLKGEAAVWARENLEPETLPQSPVGRCITKIDYKAGDEADVYTQNIHDCSFVVQAIGFSRNAIPPVKSSATGHELKPLFDHDKGVFNYVKESDSGTTGDLVRLPGLYGVGIAFPERVVDKKYGHEELNVGFFKFMKAVKKWVQEWK